MDIRFQRCKTLFGDDFFKIQNEAILILGVGGVGSYALDCLYRSGVKDITIVDYDSFEETNQNRQIGSENIGEKKVDVLSRIYKGIRPIDKKIDKKWVDEFDFERYSRVICAIDDIYAKCEVAKKCYKKLICSLGSAKRADPTKIKCDKIWNVTGDKFAKKFKDELKKRGFKESFWCIYSDEEPLCKELGSFVGVTGAFGLNICAKVIKEVRR